MTVGVVRRPWGFDGSIAITRFSEDPDRFVPGVAVLVGGRQFTIEQVGDSGRSTVLKLVTIDTEEQADELRGQTIEMEPAALPEPPAGTYYHYQIIGARVVTVDGEELGTVAEILETGSNDVYVVRRADRVAPGQAGSPSRGASEVLIPALKDVVVDVDPESGVIRVDLPEGLR